MSDIEWTDEESIGLSPALKARFWSYVTIENGGCWNWSAGTFGGRYGQFRLGKKKVKAHRVAWIISGKSIPNGLILCHHCDNPKCVNPQHMFVGTHKDNAQDRERKNRGSGNRFAKVGQPGESNPAAKLTVNDVRHIRNLHKSHGWTKKRIATHFGVSLSQIVNITLMRSWKNV